MYEAALVRAQTRVGKLNTAMRKVKPCWETMRRVWFSIALLKDSQDFPPRHLHVHSFTILQVNAHLQILVWR
jgi:hypothetical protein